MDKEAFSVYLRDHLAGSELARSMLSRVVDGEDGAFYTELDREIAEDQDALERLIHHWGAEESLPKKAVAWISEKFTRLKLTDPEAPLERFEFLEVLLLGVRGKLALWEALAHVAGPDLLPAGMDLERLMERAHSQLEKIEAKRLAAISEFASARA